jgi:hypothetical protein
MQYTPLGPITSVRVPDWAGDAPGVGGGSTQLPLRRLVRIDLLVALALNLPQACESARSVRYLKRVSGAVPQLTPDLLIERGAAGVAHGSLPGLMADFSLGVGRLVNLPVRRPSGAGTRHRSKAEGR